MENSLERLGIKLRRVADDDREILVRIYAASREVELAMVPWDEQQKLVFTTSQLDAQTAHYREHYPDATHSIIELDGEIAGRLYVTRGAEQIAIHDLTILPSFRRRGIATQIIRDLQAEAGPGRSIRVFVEAFNPGSIAFFVHHGFVAVSQDGVSVRYEWRTAM